MIFFTLLAIFTVIYCGVRGFKGPKHKGPSYADIERMASEKQSEIIRDEWLKKAKGD
jgi:hypothetical protein